MTDARRRGRDLLTAIIAAADGGSALLLAAMTLLVAYEVVMRYVFAQPTTWAHDVSGFVLLWFGFLSLAPAERGDHHIRIDLFTRKLSPPVHHALEVVIRLLLVVFGVVATWSGIEMVVQSVRLGRTTLSLLPVPMWIPQLSLPLGTALLTLEFSRRAWREVRGADAAP